MWSVKTLSVTVPDMYHFHLPTRPPTNSLISWRQDSFSEWKETSQGVENGCSGTGVVGFQTQGHCLCHAAGPRERSWIPVGHGEHLRIQLEEMISKCSTVLVRNVIDVADVNY